ncbi:unknown [Bacteroides sp. CAG:144]|nr:unknown [Bacteroides sp. CAG:144]
MLTAYLIEQIASHQTDTGDKNIEHLRIGKEKRVVYNIQRLPQTAPFDDKRNVGLTGTLCTSNDIDTVTAQRIEQFSRYAGRMFHILSHNGDRRQIPLGKSLAHLAHLYFVGEFIIKNGDSLIGIGITHGDRSIVFRSSLRHEKHTDTRLRQRLENTMIDTDNTHHTQSRNGNKAGIVYRRYSLDGLTVGSVGRLGNKRTGYFGIERIFYNNGNIFVINGINRRRIDHLCPEITQFHRLGKRELFDDIGIVDNSGIGRHKSVDISPYFETGGIECRSDNSRCIIGTATPQIGNFTRTAI